MDNTVNEGGDKFQGGQVDTGYGTHDGRGNAMTNSQEQPGTPGAACSARFTCRTKRRMPAPPGSFQALTSVRFKHVTVSAQPPTRLSIDFAGTGFDPATGNVQTGLGKNDVGYDPVTGTANQASSSSNGTLGGNKDSIPGNFPSNMYALRTACYISVHCNQFFLMWSEFVLTCRPGTS